MIEVLIGIALFLLVLLLTEVWRFVSSITWGWHSEDDPSTKERDDE